MPFDSWPLVSAGYARDCRPLASAKYNAENHQTAFGSLVLTYDLNGKPDRGRDEQLPVERRNQLSALSGPVPGSFVYDAFGRRQRKTVNSVITDFVYDGLNPVREVVGATTVNLLTELGIDEYLTRTVGGTSESLLADALGSTVALADGSGAVATEYSYEPFGDATTSGTSSPNEFGYTGRENDGTGVYYYRARYCHSGLPRLVSKDLIGFGEYR